jgi:hypothetical protein
MYGCDLNMETIKNNRIGLRSILTVGLLLAWGAISALLHSASPLISGNLAAQQLKSSDSSYFASQGAGLFDGLSLYGLNQSKTCSQLEQSPFF